MVTPTTLAEHEQQVAEWGERGPSHAISESQQHYNRLTRTTIVLNVGPNPLAPRNNVPQGYVEAQKRRTFVVLPPAQNLPNGN